MIELNQLKRVAAFRPERIVLSSSTFTQIIAELEAGRKALAQLGRQDRTHD